MHKKIAFFGVFLQLTSFVLATEQAPQDLYLVIGSTRGGGGVDNPLIKKVYDESKADLTHAKTFAGKAITVDIECCKNSKFEKRHWQADATTHHFLGRIKNAYLERLFTFDPTSQDHTKDHTSAVLLNLIKYMIPGQTKVEIEWQPCVGMAYNNAEKNKAERDSILTEKRQLNPFQGIFDINVALNSTKLAVFETVNFEGVPQSYIDEAHVWKKSIQQLINFYVGAGHVKREQLINRLKFEVTIIASLCQDVNKSLVALEWLPTVDFGILEKSRPLVVGLDAQDEGKYLVKDRQGEFKVYDQDVQVKRGETLHGKLYSYKTFVENSCFNFLWSDMIVDIQQNFVREKLATMGFRDIEIKRRRSPHNHRQNVWIISTIYDPIKVAESGKAGDAKPNLEGILPVTSPNITRAKPSTAQEEPEVLIELRKAVALCQNDADSGCEEAKKNLSQMKENLATALVNDLVDNKKEKLTVRIVKINEVLDLIPSVFQDFKVDDHFKALRTSIAMGEEQAKSADLALRLSYLRTSLRVFSEAVKICPIKTDFENIANLKCNLGLTLEKMAMSLKSKPKVAIPLLKETVSLFTECTNSTFAQPAKEANKHLPDVECELAENLAIYSQDAAPENPLQLLRESLPLAKKGAEAGHSKSKKIYPLIQFQLANGLLSATQKTLDVNQRINMMKEADEFLTQSATSREQDILKYLPKAKCQMAHGFAKLAVKLDREDAIPHYARALSLYRESAASGYEQARRYIADTESCLGTAGAK